jgi:hypothetical protein
MLILDALSSIKKPKTSRYPSLKGTDPKFRRNHRHALHGTMKALVGFGIYTSTIRQLTSCRRSWRRVSGRQHEDHNGVHDSGVPVAYEHWQSCAVGTIKGESTFAHCGFRTKFMSHGSTPARRYQSTLSLNWLTNHGIPDVTKKQGICVCTVTSHSHAHSWRIISIVPRLSSRPLHYQTPFLNPMRATVHEDWGYITTWRVCKLWFSILEKGYWNDR